MAALDNKDCQAFVQNVCNRSQPTYARYLTVYWRYYPQMHGQSAHLLLQVKFLLHGPESLRDRGIHRILGVPRAQKVSDFVPEGSTIIVDQVDWDISHLTNEMRGYLIDLATDSANNSTFRLILVVSDPDVFGTIMRLNGSEKIQDACRPRDFRWKANKVAGLIQNELPTWSGNELRKLLEALVPHATPRVIEIVLKTVRSAHTPLPPGAVIDSAQQRSLAKEAVWQRFEEVCDGLFFSSIFVEENGQ